MRRRAGFVSDLGVAETCEAEAVEEEVVAVARVVSLLMTFEAAPAVATGSLLRATGVANAGEANGLELPFVEGAEAAAAAAVAEEELLLELELETELLSAKGLEDLAVAAANGFADAVGTREAAPTAGDSRRGAAAVPFRAASLLIIQSTHFGLRSRSGLPDLAMEYSV